jgi:TPP-dependent pyruvate/acetoin dehydrogenase alpha subunit
MQKIGFAPDSFTGKSNLSDRLSLFESLLEIRFTEEMIAENYKDQQMRTAVHLGTGQEAVAVGVCSNLSKGDAVFSHHRSHNHFLASGGAVFELIAELHGHEDGCSKGRGGSVHLNHRNEVFFASTAILGESVSLAVGSALSFAMGKSQQIAIAFFGDAVWEEGVIYESLNFAAIHSIPVLFICENNTYSTESLLSSRRAEGSEFTQRAMSFGVESIKGDGNNLHEVFNLVSTVISKMRLNPKPYLIEFDTYRWREHVGPNFDHEVGRTFRSKSELVEWQKKDPVLLMRNYLKTEDSVTEDDLTILENRVLDKVGQEFNRAKNSAKPDIRTIFQNAGEL